MFFLIAMIYLIASIISSTAIFILFRWAKNFSINISGLITINYLVASILGLVVFIKFDFAFLKNAGGWVPWSVLLGILFIVIFFFIGHSSQKAGITVTTLANKLSLIFPVLFSLIWFKEQITFINYIGLLLSLIAIFLTIYRKDVKKSNLALIFLPLVIFIGSGISDSIVKLVQALKTQPNQVATFTTFVFATAFLLSLIFSFLKKEKGKKNYTTPTLFIGILLGLANFGSLYFIMESLNKSQLESSLIFAINNMSVVLLSSIIGNLVFNEKLSKINYTGIALAVLSIYFLI